MLNHLSNRGTATLNNNTCPTSHLCSYVFDASQSDISSLNPNACLFPVVEGQKFSFIAGGDSLNADLFASSKEYWVQLLEIVAGNRTDLLGDKLVKSTGIVAIEFELKAFASPVVNSGGNTTLTTQAQIISPLGNGEFISIAGAFMTSDVENQIKFSIMKFKVQNGSMDIVDTHEVIHVLNPTSCKLQHLGVYVNQDSKNIGFKINDTDLGYQYAISSQLENAFIAVNAANYATPTSLSEELSVEVITDHSRMKVEYPAGTTDICGNVI